MVNVLDGVVTVCLEDFTKQAKQVRGEQIGSTIDKGAHKRLRLFHIVKHLHNNHTGKQGKHKQTNNHTTIQASKVYTQTNKQPYKQARYTHTNKQSYFLKIHPPLFK